MSPPPAPAPAPPLMDDVVEEILLRLPPSDPGCLFRASVVCMPWRRLLTSSTFARRYREFHRTPPLLGFFERDDNASCWFAPLSPTSPFLPIHPGRRDLQALDSRHGLVLLRPRGADEEEPPESLIVWDPVRRLQWEFPPPDFAHTVTYDNAAVLCAADGCDHLGCRGGPFLVVYVGTDDYGIAYACVFSSEARTWSPVTSCQNPALPDILEILRCHPKCLVGNALYFTCEPRTIILRYDLFSRELSMIDGPAVGQYEYGYFLMTTEDGMLGCARVEESRLCLWSTETGPDGAVSLTRRRVVELEKLPHSHAHVIGFADGVGVFFLSTTSGIFTIELKSGRVKKVSICDFDDVIPYTSFYTPDQAGDITLPSTMASSSENVEVARDEYHDPLLPHSSGQVGDEDGKGEEEGEWEEEGDEEEEGEAEEGEREEGKAAKELFDKGSKAIEEGDFVGAVDCLGRALEIRVAHYGKLSPKCLNTYYKYGCALLCKAQPKSAPNQESVKGTTGKNDTRNSKDFFWRRQFRLNLDLAWKMLHIARAICEKSPGCTMEKVEIFAALAEVSMEREDIDYSLSACFKALAMLEHLVEPDHRHIIDINFRICLALELSSKIGDAIPYSAKAISLCKSRIQNLKKAKEALLADKGDNASAAEIGSEKSSLDEEIEFFTDILTVLEKKLEDLEQAISTPFSKACGEQNVGNAVPSAASLTSSQIVGPSNAMSTAATSGSSGSTGTDLGAVGRGIKRANAKQISAEPCPKKLAEDSRSVKGDSSNNSDVHPAAQDGDGSVSE